MTTSFIVFHILASLADVSSSSGGQLLVSLGSLLDDQHWHHVKLERLSSHLNLTVDKNTQQVHVPAELSRWDIHQVSEGKSAAFMAHKNTHILKRYAFQNTYFL